MRSLTNILPGITPVSRKERALRLFFHRYGDIYYNPHQVEIAWLWYGAIHICALTPGKPVTGKVSLEIAIEAVDGREFNRLFETGENLKSVIDNITPVHLWELYQRGEGEIICVLDYNCDSVLHFRKQENIIIIEDDMGNRHELEQSLGTEQQLIAYTETYFSRFTQQKSTRKKIME